MCIVGFLTASLASNPLDISTKHPPSVTTQNISGLGQMSPGEQDYSCLRTTDIQYLFIIIDNINLNYRR